MGPVQPPPIKCPLETSMGIFASTIIRKKTELKKTVKQLISGYISSVEVSAAHGKIGRRKWLILLCKKNGG